MVYDDADDHPGQWPSDFLGLKRIDQLLRCSICRGYFKNTLMVDQCSHNYCSLCIRTHLSKNKDSCPSCNKKIEDKNLRSNRVVDEFLTYFKEIRSKLLKLVIGNNEDISSSKELPPQQTTTAKVNDSTSLEKQKERRPPIQASNDLIENGENKRKPLPKMALDSFSHQQLKAKAKSFGLQMKGSPKDLKERIKSYWLKHNAECDAKQPCGLKELVRQVENEEKEKALASKQAVKPDVLYKRVDRMKESEENNKLRREHSCSYDQQYNQLSDQAERTKKQRSKQMSEFANGPSKKAIQDKSTLTKHIESSPESPVQYKQDKKKPPDKRDIRQIDLTSCDESSQSSQTSQQKSNYTEGKRKIFVGNERDETKKPNNSARNISKSINTKNKKLNKSPSDIASFFRPPTSRKDSNAVREETPNNVNVLINSQQENLSPTFIDSPEENSATQSPSMFEDFVATGGNQNHLVAKSSKQVLRQQNNTPSRKVVKQTARKTVVKNKSVCTTSKKRLRTDENDKHCHPMKRRRPLLSSETNGSETESDVDERGVGENLIPDPPSQFYF